MMKYLQISSLVPFSPFYLFNVSFVLRVIFEVTGMSVVPNTLTWSFTSSY